jgi:hypothetical protein
LFSLSFSSITIGDGSSIPISCTGHSFIQSHNSKFLLLNILVAHL